MKLELEVCNVISGPRDRRACRLPLALKLVVREGHNTHDIDLLFNERIGLRIAEQIAEQIRGGDA